MTTGSLTKPNTTPPENSRLKDDTQPSGEKGTSRPRQKLAELSAQMVNRRYFSQLMLSGIVRIVEFFLINLTGFAIYQYYVVPVIGQAPLYYTIVPAIALAAILMFQLFQLNQLPALRKPALQLLKLAGAWTLVFLFTLSVLFFLKTSDSFSRVWLLTWYFSGLATLIIERLIVSAIVSRLASRGRFNRRTVVVGAGPDTEALLHELDAQQDNDLKIYGIFDDRSDDRTSSVVGGYPTLGTVDDLVDFARQTQIDLVLFAMPITAEKRLLEMLKKLWVLPLDIRLAAHTNKLRFRPRAYSYIGSVPTLDILDKPIAGWDVIIKAAFDRIVGGVCLVALSPVFLLTALAVRLETQGPVFFRQKRYGFNNETVEILKFRSMYADKLDATANRLVTKNDPRVTRVGKFIRKTSIDELPQLFNVVFKGDLSLVGPRPHAIHAKAADQLYDQVVDGYFARHRVRPGMTGWAQVNGWRGETDTPEKLQHRVEHDLYYIENWSVLFDLYILAMTPFALIRAENAY